MIGASYDVRGTSDRILVSGDAEQALRFDATGFFKPLLTLPPRRCVDFLHIAAGIYVIDRITKRRKHDGHQGARQLRVSLRVRDAAFWRQVDVRDLVESILTFLSGDDWVLEFSEVEPNPAELGHQDFLSLPRPFTPKIAALYSGGLDSAAGLANRMVSGGNEFLLVTVAHQSGMHGRIHKQLGRVQRVVEARDDAHIDILHSTLTARLEGGKAKRMRQQEATQRTRAFLFCSCAAIAADAYGISTMPFAERTKAEMVRTLASISGLDEWLQESRSCVHTSLRERGKTHCGCCPACIERRQAFVCGGIQEDVARYQTDVFRRTPDHLDDATYLYLYQREASEWLEQDERTRRRMSDHLHLTDVPIERRAAIEQLQSRHAREVVDAFAGRPESMVSQRSECVQDISATESKVAS